ncbi:MAG TPA: M23 family metallopeptidase [Anaerolineae bacterium]|nr:M23 family metallopeptidase [Anaerolineae bacterium]
MTRSWRRNGARKWKRFRRKRPFSWNKQWPRRRNGEAIKLRPVTLAILVLALFSLSACQGGVTEEVSAEAVSVQPSPVPVTDTAVPTAIIQSTTTPLPTATEPKLMPSFNLVEASEIAPAETAVPPTPTNTAVAPTETPTNTPQPTFTPPALPQTSLEEHYWLKRPVAEGGIVWTNKEYPYGSTRGGELRPHHGVEFDVPYDTEILAAASGTVVVAGTDEAELYGPHTNFYGNLVVIEHDTRYNGRPVYTLYGHLNTPLVGVGQRVEAQEIIGLSGASGVADGPHVHLEVRLDKNSYDNTYNPLLWL